MIETVVAAAVLGVASIPHCVAMCGPLAVLSCKGRDRAGYLGARVIGYTAVGSAMGWVGAHTFAQIGDGWGRWALCAIAAVCVWRAIAVYREREGSLVQLRAKHDERGLLGTLLATLVDFVPRRGAGLGVVTAILPCGALAAAWAVAAASAHPLTGAAAMAVFALASSPALIVAMVGRHAFARLTQRVPRFVVAGAWLAGAALLLSRAWMAHASCH